MSGTTYELADLAAGTARLVYGATRAVPPPRAP